MLFATRQSSGRASRPARAQPSAYFGQWVLMTQGCTKFAEIGVQPRAAAAAMPFEFGRIAVTTIGGCGLWKGINIAPMPMSDANVRSVGGRPRLPSSRYRGPPLPQGDILPPRPGEKGVWAPAPGSGN